jgi:hypothetical protein
VITLVVSIFTVSSLENDIPGLGEESEIWDSPWYTDIKNNSKLVTLLCDLH